MSMPKEDTTFGDIEIDDEIYKIFSRPIDDASTSKVAQYKNEYGGHSSATWITDNYSWIIKDDKLYLREITIGRGSIRNLMENIFEQEELFASWQNKDVEALVSKEEFDLETDHKRRMKLVKMKIKLLKFKDGILLSIEDATKEFTMKKLKDYVER